MPTVFDSGTDTLLVELDGMVPGPVSTCESVFLDPGDMHACATPGEVAFCGRERCCTLAVGCSDAHVLEPGARTGAGFEVGEVACLDEPIQPECVLTMPNAEVTITVDGSTFTLDHVYVQHSVGFDTHASLTITDNGRADVCAPQRVSVSSIGPDFAALEAGYVGRHAVTFTVHDAGSSPPWRFVDGEIEITRSMEVPEGGSLSGTVVAEDEGVQIVGRFDDAAECVPWRGTGS